MDTRHTMNPHFDIHLWMGRQLACIEDALSSWVSAATLVESGHHAHSDLVTAMRYAVLGGGKRLRPLLVLAAFEGVCSGLVQNYLQEEWLEEAARRGAPDQPMYVEKPAETALRAACAVELVHAYSLVHDDMPCMDNDVLRRGKPTVHAQFGQASALLVGDALQSLAFELLTPDDDCVSSAHQARLCGLLSRAAGHAGMAGGQAMDLVSTGQVLTELQLLEMHRLKTGALLQASVMMGAACGDATIDVQQALQTYGAAMGLAFQVVDDILDVTADSQTLGKTAGKDAHQQKPTFVSLMGLERANAYAQQLKNQALAALATSGLSNTLVLQELTHLVVDRNK